MSQATLCANPSAETGITVPEEMADSTMASNEPNEGSHEETAQVMMQMMQQMADQINANQVQVHTLQENLSSLQQAQATPSTTANMTNPTPSSIPTEPKKKKRTTLPDPPKFNGLRNSFRPWYLEMQNKLFVDGEVIGGHRDQFAYIYSRLERIPQNMTIAYVEKGGSDGFYSPDQYFKYLYACYGDPNAQARAVDRLRTMKQRNEESFATFLPRFEKELADSGGAEWTDSVRINYLEGALNHKLRDRLISISELPTDYSDYVRTLQMIGSRLDSLELSNRQNARRRTGDQSFNRPKASTTTDTNDEMDWEPTKVNRTAQSNNDDHLRGKTAKWVDQTELDKRKNEGRCYRCGRLNCRIPICPLKPAQRPARPPTSTRSPTSTTRVQKVNQALIEEDSADDKTDQSSDDSGKE